LIVSKHKSCHTTGIGETKVGLWVRVALAQKLQGQHMWNNKAVTNVFGLNIARLLALCCDFFYSGSV